MEIKIGDVWRDSCNVLGVVEAISDRHETVAIRCDDDSLGIRTYGYIRENGTLIERDGQPIKQGPKIERFGIMRDGKHNGLPYIRHRNLFPGGTPLKYFADRELIHGYVYDFDDTEYIRCDSFAFCGTNLSGDRAMSAIILPGDDFERILPIAVLIALD